QTQEVGLAPAFYALAFRKPQNRDAGQRDLLACRRNALKRAAMSSLDHKTAGHSICGGEYILKDQLSPRKGCPEAVVELTNTCQAGFHTDIPMQNNVSGVDLQISF